MITELDNTDLEFTPLSRAYTYALKALRSPECAEAVLKKAMVDGVLRVRAKTVLKEYALGPIKPLNKRRAKMQIEVVDYDKSVGGQVDTDIFIRTHGGGQLLWNRRAGHLASVAPPPTRYSWNRVTGEPRATLPVRFIMYDVEVEISAVRKLIDKLSSNSKTSATLLAQPVVRYRSEASWRRVFPELFKLADEGRLCAKYFVRERGGRARLEWLMRRSEPDARSPSTIKRVAGMLINLDERASSNRIQQEQNLTKVDRSELTVS